LKWKVENDRYCAVGRPSYEASYRPVKIPLGIEVSLAKDLDRFFPGLRRYLGYHGRAVLPTYNQRQFSKSVWDIKVGGVRAVANWIVSYPTLLDALSGTAGPSNDCELSFRIKRGIAKEQNKLKDVLDAAVDVMESLHAVGWDTGVHGTAQT
jgi:hypothetical protein